MMNQPVMSVAHAVTAVAMAQPGVPNAGNPNPPKINK